MPPDVTTPQSAFVLFGERLKRYIHQRINNSSDAQDVLQDVFERVVRNEQALRAATTPLAWLYTVARTAVIDHYRKQGRAVAMTALEADMGDVAPDIESMPLDFEKCLVPLIDTMPMKYRQALCYVDMEGGRQVDLAEQLGMSASAAKSRVQRGRKMLKDALLSCCQVELDRLNTVIDVKPRELNDKPCC